AVMRKEGIYTLFETLSHRETVVFQHAIPDYRRGVKIMMGLYKKSYPVSTNYPLQLPLTQGES
ncbi:hypothetical protein, partial [Butyricimonas paravirosa]